MSVMLFYRVEHATAFATAGYHRGPYHPASPSTYALEDMISAHSVGDGHPSLKRELRCDDDHNVSEHLCGFDSLDQAVRWFAGWGDTLADAGYVLAIRDVPLLHIAEWQSFAIIDHVVRVEREIESTLALDG